MFGEKGCWDSATAIVVPEVVILGPLISHNTDIQNKQKELTTLHRQSHFVNKCKNMLAPSTFLQVDVIQHNGI